jgi:hypothetical protein
MGCTQQSRLQLEDTTITHSPSVSAMKASTRHAANESDLSVLAFPSSSRPRFVRTISTTNVPKVQASSHSSIVLESTATDQYSLVGASLIRSQISSCDNETPTIPNLHPFRPNHNSDVTVNALEVDSDDEDSSDETSRNSSITSYGTTQSMVILKDDEDKVAASFVEYVEYVHAIDATGDTDFDMGSSNGSIETSPSITETPPSSGRGRGVISWHTLETIDEGDMISPFDELVAYKTMTQIAVVDIKLTPALEDASRLPVILVTPPVEHDTPKNDNSVIRGHSTAWSRRERTSLR